MKAVRRPQSRAAMRSLEWAAHIITSSGPSMRNSVRRSLEVGDNHDNVLEPNSSVKYQNLILM
jgi:hypothetical protein